MIISGSIINNKIEITKDYKKEKNKDINGFFFGKIFNEKEIRKKYHIDEKDNNIILFLYRKNKNFNFLKEIDGNYYSILWDNAKKKIYIIEDKLGTYPIYYYQKEDYFFFSNSFKEIMNHNQIIKKINKQVLSNYLGYSYIYEPYTILEDVYKAEKGMILSYENRNIKKTKYFDLEDEYKKRRKNRRIEIEKEINSFYDKIGNSNNQIGIFLSSGKDSIVLSYIATKYYKKKINTYTLGFDNERDESIEAKKYADLLNTNHHTILLREKVLKRIINKMLDYYEEPFADPSLIPTIYLMENIKDYNDFYISGDGSDEVFIDSSNCRLVEFKNRMHFFYKKYIKNSSNKRWYKNSDELLQMKEVLKFQYSDHLVEKKGQVYPLYNIKGKYRRISIGELNHTCSEKYSIKMRSVMNKLSQQLYTPFYDTSLILKTFETPTKTIIHRKILNDYIKRNISFYDLDKYKKRGFGVPIEKWMSQYFLKEIKKISTKEYIEEQGLFHYEKLINLIHHYEKKKIPSQAKVLWNYYVFQLWYRKNINKKETPF